LVTNNLDDLGPAYPKNYTKEGERQESFSFTVVTERSWMFL